MSSRATRSSRLLRPVVVVPVLVVGLLVAGVAAYLFQPWKLWVDDTVNEGLPGVSAQARTAGRGGAALRVVAAGEFVSHEHETSGTARVISLPDGSRVLRLVELDTSNGPALHVWITDAPVLPGNDGWFVFDDGEYVDLGPLKGNLGSQNYPIPPSVDLATLHSVSIWCERFRVSFGAAELGG